MMFMPMVHGNGLINGTHTQACKIFYIQVIHILMLLTYKILQVYGCKFDRFIYY